MKTYPTKQSDLPALAHVLDLTELFPSDMLPDMIAPHLAGAEDSGIWLTAETRDGIAGFCYAQPEQLTEGTWNMLAIAVDPAQQSTGIGSTLVAAVEQSIKARGGQTVIVDTSSTAAFANTRAFYVAKTYVEEARIRDYWAKGDDKVVFWKSLSEG